MQKLNWNDLRYLLALKRGGSLAETARVMNVDATTVSRRLAELNRKAGEELYSKSQFGTLELTERGNSIARHVEAMETEADEISELFGSNEAQCHGLVRITSVPFFINRVLMPGVEDLLSRYPALQLDLVPDNRNLSINYRETDIAIRLARPTQGGSETLVRKIGSLDYAAYASAEISPENLPNLPWIGYDDEMAYLPTAQWIRDKAEQSGQKISNLRVQDIESAFEATMAGVGKTLLPEIIADNVASLKRVGTAQPEVSREVWLLTHSNQRTARRIVETVHWIEAMIADAGCNTNASGN